MICRSPKSSGGTTSRICTESVAVCYCKGSYRQRVTSRIVMGGIVCRS